MRYNFPTDLGSGAKNKTNKDQTEAIKRQQAQRERERQRQNQINQIKRDIATLKDEDKKLVENRYKFTAMKQQINQAIVKLGSAKSNINAANGKLVKAYNGQDTDGFRNETRCEISKTDAQIIKLNSVLERVNREIKLIPGRRKEIQIRINELQVRLSYI